jgi:hypothetical protein
MERKIQIEGAAGKAAAARFRVQSVDCLGRPGDGYRLGGVDRANLERAAEL